MPVTTAIASNIWVVNEDHLQLILMGCMDGQPSKDTTGFGMLKAKAWPWCRTWRCQIMASQWSLVEAEIRKESCPSGRAGAPGKTFLDCRRGWDFVFSKNKLQLLKKKCPLTASSVSLGCLGYVSDLASPNRTWLLTQPHKKAPLTAWS